jgi:hypothetical protein
VQKKCFDPMTDRQMGLKTGEFESFEDFYEAYKKQVRYFEEALAKQEELKYKVTGGNYVYLRSCI